MENKIVLYSTGCPKCKILEKKLGEKNMVYEKVTDTDVMIKRGFQSVPMLEVDGNTMEFGDAVRWIGGHR
jgi:glutaredoxin